MTRQRCMRGQLINSSLQKPVSTESPFDTRQDHSVNVRAAKERDIFDTRDKGAAVCTGGDAGLAFEKLAQTHLKLDSRLEAASSYVEAAKCYQKTNKAGKNMLR